MTKKILIILFIILAIITVCAGVRANTEETITTTSKINNVVVNWEYKLKQTDGISQIIELKCTNANELEGNITIPSTLDEKTVVSIGERAFESATNVTAITIPNSITEIQAFAFKNCENLTTVNLGKITTIGTASFENCTKLKSIVIPKTLVDGPYAIASYGPFKGCTNLTNVTFEEGSTAIADGLLKDLTNLKSITIPNTITTIKDYAFRNTGLTSIEIPNSVTKIEAGAFQNCVEITEIVIPNSVTEIQEYAFQDCSNLSKVDLGKIEKISYDTFKNCTKLKSIVIPKTLVDGPYAIVNGGPFKGCTNLTNVTFEEGSTVIANGLLKDLTSVKSIKIPDTVTTIKDYAFRNTGLTSIEIPNSVTKIEAGAFQDCEDLTKITILDNVVELGNYKETSNNVTDSVFKNHNENLTIYCYESSIAAKYAIANNIKYEYITKPSTQNPAQNVEDKSPDVNNTGNVGDKGPIIDNTGNVGDKDVNDNNGNSNDTTVAPSKIPQTGVNNIILIYIFIIALVAIVCFVKYYKYRDIK